MLSQKLILEQYEKARQKKPPVKPRLKIDRLKPLDPSELFEGELFVSKAVTNAKLTDANFSHRSFCESAFTNSSFQECGFSDTSFEDVVFSGCDFSVADFTSAGFKRCAFDNCKLTGTTLFEFYSLLTFATCSQSKWKNISLAKCDLSEADFCAMQLSSASIEDCKIVCASFF